MASFLSLPPLDNDDISLPRINLVHLQHDDISLLGINLIAKRSGGVMVRSAPKHKNQIRRGMTLITINKIDVSTTASLSEILPLLLARPLDLVFRPAPSGSFVEGAPDPNAPPVRPTPKFRHDAALYTRRILRKNQLRKTHLKMVQRYRIGPPREEATKGEREMCVYRNTFHERRESRKQRLRDEFFRKQWQRRYAGYARTLEVCCFAAMFSCVLLFVFICFFFYVCFSRNVLSLIFVCFFFFFFVRLYLT